MNIDELCVNSIRVLAADTVQKSNSGHPGAPMGCAPMAHVLFGQIMKMNPNNPKWFNRDRFVLSNGHACVLQYILLHLLGYKVSMADLQKFRQLDSITPGHPENHMTDGIEVTTGPLGQGIANAVGLAIASKHLGAMFNKNSYPVINNFIYAIVGDGCLQEGVALEAISLAGHLGLGNLVVLYDDNRIQIDGSTELAFSENVLDRMKACGWHTQEILDGDTNLTAIASAIEAAKKETSKPSIIKIKTLIGFGSKHQGTEKVHGAPLGEDDVAAAKKKLGFDPEKSFFVPDEVKRYYASVKERGAQLEADYNAMFQKYAAEFPQLAAELQRRIKGELPSNWKDTLPRYTPDSPAVGSRKYSEVLLNAIADRIPELVGGSADLTGSNLTRWKTAVDFQKDGSSHGNYSGRYLRFGVREHAMAAISNGLAAYGAIIPFCATFLNFLGYAQGAFRLSAVSHFRVIYIMTHDSIGLGEDGPTHQPIEILALTRATPNVLTFRPADGNEVSGAYAAALEHPTCPSVIALSRQNLPNNAGSSIEKTIKGAYILSGEELVKTDVVLVATGSEVHLALEASKILTADGINVRVVSMPCWELFEKQTLDYQQSVLPPTVPALGIEVYSSLGWEKWVHAHLGMKTFGASAPFKELYKKFGFTSQNIAEKAKKLIAFYSNRPVPSLLEQPF